MNKEQYNIGIIGSGLQANRRLHPILDHPKSNLTWIAGIEHEATQLLAKKGESNHTSDWNKVVNDLDVDVVVICTPPHLHFEIAKAALNSGKHVLCEKPLTRSSQAAKELVTIAKYNNVLFKCGFNHRHHPAMLKAKELIEQGAIGTPVSGRAVYGICGREGCETEWRSDPKISAGGQLMEQGIHCIDLFRWYVGDFDAVSAHTSTTVFPIDPFEDTATALLHQNSGVAVTVHSSITQWRNRFRLELYGSEGYVEINGLGGSYDLQTLKIGKREPNAPFNERVIDYRGGDKSWRNEWNYFMDAIINDNSVMGSGEDAVKAMQLVEAAYESSRKKNRIDIPSTMESTFSTY